MASELQTEVLKIQHLRLPGARLAALARLRPAVPVRQARRCASRSAKSSTRAADAEASRSSPTASAEILRSGFRGQARRSNPFQHFTGVKSEGAGDLRIID